MSITVILERLGDGIVVMSLNRPDSLNALSVAMRREIVANLTHLSEDADCRVLIVTGAGRAFCAGLDLRELGTTSAGLASIDEDDPVGALASFPHPVIIAVNGPAVTGGFEFALAGDIRIASTLASFADTHALVGVMPGWGLSQRLSRLIGVGRAKEMSFTGRFIGAEQALSWGLVNDVVEPQDLLPRAISLAHDILRSASGIITSYKSIIDDGYALSFGAALTEEVRRANSFNASVSAGAVSGRTEDVLARGRKGNKPA